MSEYKSRIQQAFDTGRQLRNEVEGKAVGAFCTKYGGKSTDRELLELAAKAAGWELVWGPYDQPEPGEKSIEFDVRRKGIYGNWNPLYSRHDADRLAAVLGLNAKMGRRAIVRAAAEVGRGMK